MAYLNLSIKSGGLISKAAGWELNMGTELVENEQKLRLIRHSSIEGIWAYLLGYTCRVKDNMDKLKFDQEWLWLCKNTKIKVTRLPFGTTFFSRKDLHFDKSKYSLNPSVNLKGLGYDDADASIRLLFPILKKMTGSEDLGVIHSYFDDKEYKKKKENIDDKSRPDVSLLPLSKMGKSMRKYVEEVYDSNSYSKNIFVRAIELINNVIFEIQSNDNFNQAFKAAKESKFSCFTSSLNQPRHWIKSEAQSFVRGEPKDIICVDFDLVVEERPPVSVVNRLLAGPMVASWGEGGFGVLVYDSDGNLPNIAISTEQPLLSYKELRGFNLKLKLQEWEKKDINGKKL